jgi:hypothetical protein
MSLADNVERARTLVEAARVLVRDVMVACADAAPTEPRPAPSGYAARFLAADAEAIADALLRAGLDLAAMARRMASS